MIVYIGVFVLVALLIVFIFANCVLRENFTAPGLTLTPSPSWMPVLAAKAYNEDDWKERQYLDRYPFFDTSKGENKYLSQEESDRLASAYRLWTDDQFLPGNTEKKYTLR